MEQLIVREIVNAVNGTLLFGTPDDSITSVSTNSKEIEEGGLFVPIIGEHVDAHQFISSALQIAAATFTSRTDIPFIDGKIYIQVENTLKALQELATYYREKFPIPVIGVTGSVGKTTTKEMIAAALETKYCVLKTSGNMNSQVGLPLTMFRLETSHEIAVIEMGISEAGEMERLVNIAKPTFAVLTNIGVSHIGQLKTKENIRKEKLNFINQFHMGSTLFLNGNDPLLMEVVAAVRRKKVDTLLLSTTTEKKLQNAEVITYGIGEKFDYSAISCNTIKEEQDFILKVDERKEQVHLKVLGEHNISNAMVALAVAHTLGIAPNQAKKGLEAYVPIAMRGQIVEKNGIRIIDDTYNASPDSMKSGIRVLVERKDAKRRIAILADAMELGDISYQCHYEVGTFIANQAIDLVVTIGTEARAIAKAILDSNAHIITKTYENNAQAIAYLKEELRTGDIILVKGSRGMHTDEIVKAFC